HVLYRTVRSRALLLSSFFFRHPPTTGIYPLSLHDALPIWLKPWWPVEQKRQLTAQPAWLDTHSVPRSSSGMKTVSMALPWPTSRSEEHTSELQSRENLVCRLLLEKKKKQSSVRGLITSGAE